MHPQEYTDIAQDFVYTSPKSSLAPVDHTCPMLIRICISGIFIS